LRSRGSSGRLLIADKETQQKLQINQTQYDHMLANTKKIEERLGNGIKVTPTTARMTRKVTTPVLKVANSRRYRGPPEFREKPQNAPQSLTKTARRHPVARLHPLAVRKTFSSAMMWRAHRAVGYGEPYRNRRVTTLTHSYVFKSAAVPRSCRRGYRDIVAHRILRKSVQSPNVRPTAPALPQTL
jgi:hypothetical protein